MLKVIGCVTTQHDPWLVGLASIVCLLASVTAVKLMRYAMASAGQARAAWLGVAAVACGSGIWATHFIWMLAFSPGVPSGFDASLTILSLVAAIVPTGCGLALATARGLSGRLWLGGLVIGGGIAAMHSIGMAAYEVAGRTSWDMAALVASVMIGCAFAVASLWMALGRQGGWSGATGALLLAAAICGHHAVGISALTIAPDPAAAVSVAALTHGWLAVLVASGSALMLLMAAAARALDRRERLRREQAQLVHGLVNAAVEGIVVCDEGRIVAANRSLAALLGVSPAALTGRMLDEVMPGLPADMRLHEMELAAADGERIPVEVIRHEVPFAGRPHLAVAVRDMRSRRQAERDIAFLAHHDTLTGLPNRAAFNARLDNDIARACAEGRQVAVLCIDLDRFKEVNDIFGHAAGDRMLQAVAQAVTPLIDSEQMMARLGGDEFAITMPGLTRPARAERLADDVLQALRAASNAQPGEPALGASIGIAICPEDGTDRQTLMSHADAALYRAKADGRGTYRGFDARMASELRDRRGLHVDLRQAIARGEMRLEYQPQFRVDNGEPVGFEALLRWRHPERGDVPPVVFIPVAEESGGIVEIGAWVLREACLEAARWPRPLGIAVNVSAVQLRSGFFVREVEHVLADTGLLPERLELEVTETALVLDFGRALGTLRRLKALGVRIAMDDFGTGYSSLANLRAFPFDRIKIDRSFVRSVDENPQAATIVRAVLGLGHGLGLPVLAEGVETRAELTFLGKESCQVVQGFLLGRPAPIATFVQHTHPSAGQEPLGRRATVNA